MDSVREGMEPSQHRASPSEGSCPSPAPWQKLRVLQNSCRKGPGEHSQVQDKMGEAGLGRGLGGQRALSISSPHLTGWCGGVGSLAALSGGPGCSD